MSKCKKFSIFRFLSFAVFLLVLLFINSHFTITASAACSHVYGVYIITEQPTCATPGSRYRICQKCGYKSTEMILPPGHTITSRVVKPTCTQKGYTHVTCKVSGCNYSVKHSYTQALGHSLKTTSAKAPTCTAQGVLKHYCTRCSYYYNSAIPAHGHVYSGATNTCAICGYVRTGWSYMFKSPKMATHISQSFPYYDDGTEHHGIDIIKAGGGTEGYPIYCAYNGNVIAYSLHDTGTRGAFIEIQQDNGYIVRYLHMIDGSPKYKYGDRVSAGALLGQVGNTGLSFGPHLHFDVKNSSGAYIQPVTFFPDIKFTYSY